MIGTNDLHGLGRSREPSAIASQVENLLEQLEQRAPLAPILLNSVLPRSRRFALRIRDLNQRYRQLAGGNVTYVDLWSAMADSSGALRGEFTRDGLHLNGAGYRAWVDVLRPHIDRALAQGLS